MTTREDIVGRRYGRLVVVALARTSNYKAWWECRCDCGASKVVNGVHVKAGKIRSCGCLQRESARERALGKQRNLQHGHALGRKRTPEFAVWLGMRWRCAPTAPDATRRLYFGRGIRVCERWQAFENFLADMGERPSPTHSIDRIDNSKGYEPGNCRWATPLEQSRNSRRPRDLTIRGATKSRSEWAEIAGVPKNTIHNRLHRGWPAEEAVFGRRPEGAASC